MERLYKEDDCRYIIRDDPQCVMIQGNLVPYTVLDNGDDVTTQRGEALGDRLEQVLCRL